MSVGRVDTQFRLQIIGPLLVELSVLIGLCWGARGVALCYTVQAVVWVCFHFSVIAKLIVVTSLDFMKALRISIAIAFFMGFSYMLKIGSGAVPRYLFINICIN